MLKPPRPPELYDKYQLLKGSADWMLISAYCDMRVTTAIKNHDLNMKIKIEKEIIEKVRQEVDRKLRKHFIYNILEKRKK